MRSSCQARTPALRGRAGAGGGVDIRSVAVQAGTFCSARTQRGKKEWQRAVVAPPHHTVRMKHSSSNSGP